MGAAGDLAGVREACRVAVRTVWDARPDLLVLVGTAPATGPVPLAGRGSLAGYGVGVEVTLDPAGAPGAGPAWPLSLTVGAWLLQQAGGVPRGTAVALYGVHPAEPPARCTEVGAGLARRAARVGLLVLGAGTACRSEKAPGYLDPRAADFDAAVARALAAADPAALAALDPALAERLGAAGRGPWQVLAGAAGNGSYTGELLAEGDPWGVAYLVAAWRRAAGR